MLSATHCAALAVSALCSDRALTLGMRSRSKSSLRMRASLATKKASRSGGRGMEQRNGTGTMVRKTARGHDQDCAGPVQRTAGTERHSGPPSHVFGVRSPYYRRATPPSSGSSPMTVLRIAFLLSIAASTVANAQQTRVVVLGTGTPNADPDRSGPAIAIVTGSHA